MDGWEVGKSCAGSCHGLQENHPWMDLHPARQGAGTRWSPIQRRKECHLTAAGGHAGDQIFVVLQALQQAAVLGAVRPAAGSSGRGAVRWIAGSNTGRRGLFPAYTAPCTVSRLTRGSRAPERAIPVAAAERHPVAVQGGRLVLRRHRRRPARAAGGARRGRGPGTRQRPAGTGGGNTVHACESAIQCNATQRSAS